MSLIVATPQFMICDSFLGNEEVQYKAGPKIFTNGLIAVGVVGSLKAARDIKRMVSKAIGNEHPAQMCDKFARAIESEYQVLVADGISLWESNEAGDTFEIFPQNSTSYGAIGQGYMYALGALFVGGTPKEAIQAATQYSPLVSAPFLATYNITTAWTPLREGDPLEYYSE